MSDKLEKPKFDKKKWRTQKYSKKVKGMYLHIYVNTKMTFFAVLSFLHTTYMYAFFLVDNWQEKRKKYIQGKYFRMLQKEGLSKNPNMVPLGQTNPKYVEGEKTAGGTREDSEGNILFVVACSG